MALRMPEQDILSLILEFRTEMREKHIESRTVIGLIEARLREAETTLAVLRQMREEFGVESKLLRETVNSQLGHLSNAMSRLEGESVGRRDAMERLEADQKEHDEKDERRFMMLDQAILTGRNRAIAITGLIVGPVSSLLTFLMTLAFKR